MRQWYPVPVFRLPRRSACSRSRWTRVEEERVSARSTRLRILRLRPDSNRKSWPESGVQSKSGVVLPLRLWPLRFHTAWPLLGASRLGAAGPEVGGGAVGDAERGGRSWRGFTGVEHRCIAEV